MKGQRLLADKGSRHHWQLIAELTLNLCRNQP